MDMLADVAAMREDAAAEILNGLRAQQAPDSPAPPSVEDHEVESPESAGESVEPIDEPVAQPWSRAEDDLLRRLSASKALAHSPSGRRGPTRSPGMDASLPVWQEVSDQLEGRSPAQCMHRWQAVLNAENIKGPWCPNEDAQLVELVSQYGGKHWAHIASMLPGRTGKQCRERWCNNLDPTLKKGAWSAEEDQIILQMHAKLGTRWAEIAKCLPGRSDNSVKNRWYSTCSRVLRQQQEAMADGADTPEAHVDAHLSTGKDEPDEGTSPPLAVRPKPARHKELLLSPWDDAGRVSPSTHELATSGPLHASTPPKIRAARNSAGSPRDRKRKAPAASSPITVERTPPPALERPPKKQNVPEDAEDDAGTPQHLNADVAPPSGSCNLPLAWKPLGVTPPQLGEVLPTPAVLSAEVY